MERSPSEDLSLESMPRPGDCAADSGPRWPRPTLEYRSRDCSARTRRTPECTRSPKSGRRECEWKRGGSMSGEADHGERAHPSSLWQLRSTACVREEGLDADCQGKERVNARGLKGEAVTDAATDLTPEREPEGPAPSQGRESRGKLPGRGKPTQRSASGRARGVGFPPPLENRAGEARVGSSVCEARFSTASHRPLEFSLTTKEGTALAREDPAQNT